MPQNNTYKFCAGPWNFSEGADPYGPPSRRWSAAAPAQWATHLNNSRRTFLKLVEKARTFDQTSASALTDWRDYQALDLLVIEHLLG